MISCLNDAGFKWSLKAVPTKSSVFDNRFNDLMSFKAKYGQCDFSQTGEFISLEKWCSELRSSYKKFQNNQTPKMKLSDDQIQRLNDAGFKFQVVSVKEIAGCSAFAYSFVQWVRTLFGKGIAEINTRPCMV
jgi:hypothetical protein